MYILFLITFHLPNKLCLVLFGKCFSARYFQGISFRKDNIKSVKSWSSSGCHCPGAADTANPEVEIFEVLGSRFGSGCCCCCFLGTRGFFGAMAFFGLFELEIPTSDLFLTARFRFLGVAFVGCKMKWMVIKKKKRKKKKRKESLK